MQITNPAVITTAAAAVKSPCHFTIGDMSVFPNITDKSGKTPAAAQRDPNMTRKTDGSPKNDKNSSMPPHKKQITGKISDNTRFLVFI
ncbi:MAG: hypothetical protein II820_11670 [Ruminiclostridium sp.]|nr:hypothetical protein [Ruminiclostridium sp.]